MEMLYGPVYNFSTICQNCDSSDVKIECSGCNAAYLCSKKCEEEHRFKRGKEIQKLGKKIRSDRKARFMEKLCREKLALLISEFDPTCCNYCQILFPPKDIKICAACATARYCSKDCQVKEWTLKHKEQCREMRDREKVFDFDENEVTFQQGFGSNTETVENVEEWDVLKREVATAVKVGKNCSLQRKLASMEKFFSLEYSELELK